MYNLLIKYSAIMVSGFLILNPLNHLKVTNKYRIKNCKKFILKTQNIYILKLTRKQINTILVSISGTVFGVNTLSLSIETKLKKFK